MFYRFLVITVLILSGLSFSCQGNGDHSASKSKDIILAEEICVCSDALYQFNREAQRTLPDATNEMRAQILRTAEEKMNELEQCIIRSMGKKQIEKGEIDLLLLEKRLSEQCTNKPQTFLKRVLQDIKPIF